MRKPLTVVCGCGDTHVIPAGPWGRIGEALAVAGIFWVTDRWCCPRCPPVARYRFAIWPGPTFGAMADGAAKDPAP